MRKLTTNTTFTSNAHCDLSNLVIFGKTQKVNQLVRNGNFESTSGWNYSWYPSTLSASNNVLTVAATDTSIYKNSAGFGAVNSNVGIIEAGNIIFYSFKIKYKFGNSQYRTIANYFYQRTSNQNRQIIFSININSDDWVEYKGIVTLTYGVDFASQNNNCIYVNSLNIGDEAQEFYVKDYKIANLTTRYGAGNEPTTVEQFLSDHPEFNDYVDYTGPNGALLSVNGKVTQKVGRNIWDEETESGYIRSSDGSEVADGLKIRMKNYVPVLPNTTYYYLTPQPFWVCCFDANKNYIGRVGGSKNTTFITPSNCAFIRCGFETAYGTTYNHDICINESDSLNGTYSPHISGELTLSNLRGVNDVKDIWFGKSPNLWDEEYESGSYDANGNPTVDAARIRTKNPIEVIPNTSYFLNIGTKTIGYRFYDIKDNFISGSSSLKGTIISPRNARYLRFSIVNTTTYNNDICINESNSLINGLYVRHYAENVILRNLVEKDFGDCNWSLYNNSFYTDLTDIWQDSSSNESMLICSRYLTGRTGGSQENADGYVWKERGNTNTIYVKDSSYLDAASFKSGNVGTKIIYRTAQTTFEYTPTTHDFVQAEGQVEMLCDSQIKPTYLIEYYQLTKSIDKQIVYFYEDNKLVMERYDDETGKLIYEFVPQLPEPYQAVEYIESHGTEYIDTGYIPKLDKTNIIVNAIKQTSASLFGSGNGGFIFTGISTVHYAYYNMGISSNLTTTNEFHNYQMNKNKVLIDNDLKHTFTLSTATLNETLYLFASHYSSGVSDAGNHKIKKCLIYEDNSLIRYSQPCYNKNTGVIGMYDFVTNTFLVNQGTGTFGKGREK